VGVALSMLHGYACVSHRGDQVVLGMAITMTAAGLTVVLGIAWFKQGGQTPPLPEPCAWTLLLPGLAAGRERHAGVGRCWPGPAGPQRLRLRHAGRWWPACGGCCTARASACACAPPARTRRWSTPPASRCWACATGAGLNGVLAALAGAYLVLALNPSFIPNMTAGRGYMALAAMIFGKWHPVGALLGLPAVRLPRGARDPAAGRGAAGFLGGGAVPVQAIQALPYVLTVVLLAGFIGRALRAQGAGPALHQGALMMVTVP
jgi:general nucleoside transport system permease protein